MVRPEQAVSHLRVRVPSGQASEHPVAGPSLGEEISQAERGVKSLTFGGSEKAGRNKLNAVASSKYQPKGVRDGRAAHFTAKATDRTKKSEVGLDIPGVCRRRHARKV